MSSSNNLKLRLIKALDRRKKQKTKRKVRLFGSVVETPATGALARWNKERKKSPCEFPRKRHPDNSLIPHPVQSPFTQAFHLHKQGRRVGQKTFDQVRVNLSTVWTRRALLCQNSTSEGLWKRGAEWHQIWASAPNSHLCSIFSPNFFCVCFISKTPQTACAYPHLKALWFSGPRLSLLVHCPYVLVAPPPIRPPPSSPPCRRHVWAPLFFILQISCDNSLARRRMGWFLFPLTKNCVPSPTAKLWPSNFFLMYCKKDYIFLKSR